MPGFNQEVDKILELMSNLNSKVAKDESLTYVSDDEYDRILEGVKKLTICIYNHKLVATTSHDRLEELTDIMTSMASLDFSKKAEVSSEGNHLDYIAIGLNLMSYQLAKQVEPMKILSALFDCLKEPIIVTNKEDKILLVNAATLQLTGYEQNELYQCNADTLIADKASIQSNPKHFVATSIITKSGQRMANSFSFYELKNTNEEIIGHVFYGNSADLLTQSNSPINDLKEIEEKYPLDFNRVHHDIMSPIKSMQGAVTLGKINAKDKDTSKLFEIIDKCRKSVEVHIKDLFDMIFLKSNKLFLERVNFEEVINNILTEFAFREEKIKININIAPGATVYSNKKLINSILQNLLSNAIKYRKDDEKSFVNIDVLNCTERGVCIRISDNGIGIKPEDLQKIFNPHFRASLKTEGKGLGLYIVKQAIEKLNGTITAESSYGEGTSFNISFPDLS